MEAAMESGPGSNGVDQLDLDRTVDLYGYLSLLQSSMDPKNDDMKVMSQVRGYRTDRISELVNRFAAAKFSDVSAESIKSLAILTLIFTSGVDGHDTRDEVSAPSEFRITAGKTPRA